MRKLGVEEWIVKTVQAMYESSRSSVRVNNMFSEEFPVNVGVHQGSVLSPLLFIIVMEALSREFRVSCPWEILYADDLVIVSESLDVLIQKLMVWKRELESKGLRVNMGKTKVLHSSYGNNLRIKTGKWPCGVCQKGVGVNSIYCPGCKCWIHNVAQASNFGCKNCLGGDPPAQLTDKVEVGDDHLDMVNTFTYLGDVIGDKGGCADAITHRLRGAWKKFRDLLPILTNKGISFHTRGHVFVAAVRGVMLHASETWPMTAEDVARVVRNDHSMIRWICSKKLSDRCSISDLRTKLQIPNIVDVMRQKRLRWYGHVLRMDDNAWQKMMMSYNVNGAAPRGRPKLRWIDSVKKDMKELGINTDLTLDRSAWRQAIRI